MLFRFQQVSSGIPGIDLRTDYKAEVVDNADPLRLGRIKVHIPQLFGSEKYENTPWISPVSPSQQGGRTDASSFSVPDLGSIVLVSFPYNKIYLGFYKGYWQSFKTHAGDFNDSYPHTHGSIDSTGTGVRIDKLNQQAVMNHASGASATVDKKGNITIRTKGSISLLSENGDVGITIDCRTGKVTTKSLDSTEIKSPLSIENSIITIDTGRKSESVRGVKEVRCGGSSIEGVGTNKSVSVVGGSTRFVGMSDIATTVGKYERSAGGPISIKSITGKIDIAPVFPGTGIRIFNKFIRMGTGNNPMVKGKETIQWLAKHTHPTGSGPSGPPIEAAETVKLFSKEIIGA